MEEKSISPSNAIDQMISISITRSDAERSRLFQRIFDIVPSIKRTNKLANRSRFSKIDSLKRSAWNKTSPRHIERAEMRILTRLNSHFEGRYIPVLNNTEKIWTIYSNLHSNNIPIVLLHGFAGGVCFWSLNLDQLCSNRPVYVIDLPGFARSSRPIFSSDPVEAEKQFVDMIEQWRIEIGLNQEFIIAGHSFGGFLSTSYALHYPKYVKQLILIDPWGFSLKPEKIWETGRLKTVPIWLRPISSLMMKRPPLATIRVAGPLGLPVMKYVRSDYRVKFEQLFDDDRILVYVYHCNAQLPTGEQAFRTMSDCVAWAKKPMIQRIHLLDEQIPIHFLHGEYSWITTDTSLIAQTKRVNIFIETIKGAGHNVHMDQPVEFDMCLKRILFNRDMH